MMQAQPIGKRSILLFLAFVLIHFTGSGQNAETPYRIKTIVVDAGHGGKDPGNLGTGRYKAKEKDISLEIALRVGTYIKTQFPEINVIYTRQTDVFIGLNERADVANTAHADLFISIHCNAFKNPASNGVETYVLGLHRNQENLEVAMKENSSIYMEKDYKTKYEGFDPNSAESIIALTIMQSAFLQQSLQISANIQEQFKNRVGRKDRGVKQAGFLVLRRTTMPSILIELGFLTNAAEEDFLNSENGKAFMSSAIFRGFKDYKDMVEDPLPEGTAVPNSESTAKIDQAKADEKAKQDAALEAKRKSMEKAKQDSMQKLADQAKLKAVADSLERKKSQLLEEKKLREAALTKQEEAKKAAMQAQLDSLELVKQQKVASLEKREKELAEEKAAQLRAAQEAKRKEEEAKRLAEEEKARKAEEAKLEATKWLEEIKAEKEKELEEAKRQAAIEEEKQRLEAIKQEKLHELELAKAEQAKADAKAREESMAAAKLIQEQARIDSLAKARSAENLAQLNAANLARNEEVADSIATAQSKRQEELGGQAQKAKRDSIDQANDARELAKQDSILVAEVELATQRMKKQAMEDSIAKVKKPKTSVKPVTIDSKKATTPEEAELLFLQLRKKQLEQRIAELKDQNVQAVTLETLKQPTLVAQENPTDDNKVIEKEPIVAASGAVENGLILKVQIVTSAKQLRSGDPLFKGKEVWEYQQGGLYKYTVGSTKNFAEITKLQGELRNFGFKEAFVVAFNNGERIKVSEAREMLNITE